MRGVDRSVDTVRCIRIHAVGEVSAILSCEQLLGLEDTHVVALDAAWCLGDCRLHPLAVQALARLRADAHEAGFDLRVVSGFRSFERQAAIWNAKASGLRPVLDAAERPIDTSALEDAALVFSILRWSALPGASRHHWGTDMDVVDATLLEPGRPVSLRVADTCDEGMFAALHRWLDERIASGRAHGFFRPYTGAGCKVAPEPWHLSFAPLAWECQRSFDPLALAAAHRRAGLALHAVIEASREQILQGYFDVPAALYARALADCTVVVEKEVGAG